MSSIYQQLTEADTQVEKDIRSLRSSSYSKNPQSPSNSSTPRLGGIKVALLGAYLLGLIGILGGLYLYYELSMESQRRLALETTHVALSKRTVAIEVAIDDQKERLGKVNDAFSQSTKQDQQLRDKIQKEIDSGKLQLAELGKKIGKLEESLSALPEVVQANSSSNMNFNSSAPRVVNLTSETQVVPDSPAQEPATVQNPATPVVVTSSETSQKKATVAAQPGTQKVLTVNRQFKFVVVNLGLVDSVKVGDKLAAMRGGKKIAELQIEKLYDSFSAAAIIQEDAKSPIDVGDAIVRAS